MNVKLIHFREASKSHPMLITMYIQWLTVNRLTLTVRYTDRYRLTVYN